MSLDEKNDVGFDKSPEKKTGAFIARLPKGINSWNKSHIRERRRKNLAIARALTTRRDALAAIHESLEIALRATGLTFEDLLAFHRDEEDKPVFPTCDPCVIPAGFDRRGRRVQDAPESPQDAPAASDEDDLLDVLREAEERAAGIIDAQMKKDRED